MGLMEVAEVLRGCGQQSHERSWGQSGVVPWRGWPSGRDLPRAWGAPCLL